MVKDLIAAIMTARTEFKRRRRWRWLVRRVSDLQLRALL